MHINVVHFSQRSLTVPKPRKATRACHKAESDTCGNMFVAVIVNRGRKFVTKEGSLTSSKGGAELFTTQIEALAAAKGYAEAHFSN